MENDEQSQRLIAAGSSHYNSWGNNKVRYGATRENGSEFADLHYGSLQNMNEKGACWKSTEYIIGWGQIC